MNKYCYVTLFFGNKDYIEGVILVALGLLKQKVKYPIICLITNDMIEFKNLLLQFYDEVIIVPIISTSSNEGIKISKNILKNEINQDHYMTKLHIFNKRILNYDKVVYVDADLIPVDKFDALFNYNSPAGWLEKIHNGMHIWSYWVFSSSIIPEEYTNISQHNSSEINTGLLIVEPNNKIFDDMINILQSNDEIEKKYWGCVDETGKFTQGYNRVDQQFITQYFSGKWNYVDEKYNVWGGLSNKKIYGLHMAGLRFKINNKDVFGKTWNYQTLFNSAYDKITNETLMWGIKNIKIKEDYDKIFFNNLQIILKNDETIKFSECPLNVLTSHQKLVKILLNSK